MEQNSRFFSYSIVMSTTVPLLSIVAAPGATDQYRNQYQTASGGYVRIPADTHGFENQLRQKGPKMGPSGAIPTLASIPNSFDFQWIFEVFVPPNPRINTGINTGNKIGAYRRLSTGPWSPSV